MANYTYNIDVDYNVKAASSQGGGILSPDTTYEFVTALPTGTDVRQDRFYKVSGDEGLYWWSGVKWINLADTVVRSGIIEVPALPTTDIKTDSFYHVTGTSILNWYNTLISGWIDVSTNHIVQVDSLTSVTNPSHTVLYQLKDSNKLYFYNNDSQWMDIAYDNGIQIVTAIPTTGIVSDKLYFLQPSGILYWYNGTNWIDLTTNFGVVKVATKPTTGMRQDCLYFAADDTDSIWWYNGSKWVDLAEPTGIIIWGETYPPYEMTSTPSDKLIYNWLSDDSLWWYNSHSNTWVDISKDTAIVIVSNLTAAEKRQDKLYKPLYETAIYWWNGTKWYDIYKNYGIVEVASYPTASIRSDCLYKLIDDTDLMWWNGNKWVDISTTNGIIKTTALPASTDATHTNLYWVNDSTNGNKLYWLNFDNAWVDLADEDGIITVNTLPLTSDGNNLYRLTTDNNLYYYTNTWYNLTQNTGIVVVTALPSSLDARMDCIYKVNTENKLYWWNGNQWKIISDNGGMVEVSSLPTTPTDTSVLYRLTSDQYDPTTGELLYGAWVYAWVNGAWEKLKSEIIPCDRGLSIVNNKVGHANSISAKYTEGVSAFSFDEYGHITGATTKGFGRGLSDFGDTIGHANTAVIADTTNQLLRFFAFDEYGHVTSQTPTTIGRGLSNSASCLGHSNSAITAVSTANLYKIKFNNYGHITGYTAYTPAVQGADRGLSVSSYKVGHSNSLVAQTSWKGIQQLKFDAYGHVTAYSNVTIGDGLALSSGTLKHSNSTTARSNSAVYKLTIDSQGHVTGSTQLSSEKWTFTLTDGTTVTRTVWY